MTKRKTKWHKFYVVEYRGRMYVLTFREYRKKGRQRYRKWRNAALLTGRKHPNPYRRL